jgi:hypothetical protein
MEEEKIHPGLVLAHEEKFKNYDKQIEVIFNMLREASEVVNKHICSSIERIRAIDKAGDEISYVKKEVQSIKDGHREIRGWAITILITLLTASFTLTAQMNRYAKQIDINTARLSDLEALHPRIAK